MSLSDRSRSTVRTVAYASHMQRLRPLSEQECYLRCYGHRSGEDTVKVLPAGAHVTGEAQGYLAEQIRLAFEARIDEREPEAA